MKKPFLPRTDADRMTWLTNFVVKLSDTTKAYPTKYNVAASVVTRLANGLLWLQWTFENMTEAQVGSRTLTSFKNQSMNGTVMPTIPTATAYTTAPTVPYEPGIFILAGSVGQQIKDSTVYALVDGQDLELEGATMVLPDPATMAPLLQTRPASGGMTEIVWPKGMFEAIKLMVDRGDGKGSIFLAMDTEPNYIDTVRPAAGTSATYTYIGIYMLHDEEYGQWSQPVQATLRG